MRAGREGADLVVWAETAVPDYLILVPDLLDWIRHLAIDARVNLFLGYPHARMLPGHEQPLRYNGAGLFGPDGRLKDFYAKAHLLPFGENMPFSSVLPFLSKIDFGQAEWAPGAPPAPIRVDTSHGEYSIACLICFEAILPGLSRGAVRRGAEYLVNITNDGWFGETAGPRQHAELARMRAAECGVPMVRCANNGISYITDDRGGFLCWAGLQRRVLLMDDVPPGRGATLFVRVGAWPLAILLVLWTAGVILAPRLTTSARRSP
jgi:apolipoprotein N-acyltransferase